MSLATPEHVNAFWLGPALECPDLAVARKAWWYRGGPAVDAEIRQHFSAEVDLACKDGLREWQNTPEGAFALILLLDQFTRNLFRGTSDAWRGDPLAFRVVTEAIAAGLDKALHPVERIWLYHPYHHSEALAEQDAGIALLHALCDEAPAEWRAYVEQAIEGWTKHRDVVARFGRFPHRNPVLGLKNTPAEAEYLAGGAENYGQAAGPG